MGRTENRLQQKFDKKLDRAMEHFAAGRLTQARSLFEQLHKSTPGHPVPLHMLGFIGFHLGDHDNVIDLISQAITIAPDYIDAHFNLGNALMAYGRLNEAIASYTKAIALDPNFIEAHENLGDAYSALGNLGDAVASYRRVVAILPDYAEVYISLGNALFGLDELDEAVASFAKAIEIKPDYALAHGNLADVLDKANRTEDLREALIVAKQNCPDHPRLMLGQAQLFKRDGDYAAARAVLEDGSEGVDDARFLTARAHLLGDLCDRLDDTDAAFRYFSEGNRRSREAPEAAGIEGQQYLDRIDGFAERFTPELIADWQPFESGDGRPDPVFLVGFPRSGTTLLDTILRSHEAVTVVEEKPTVNCVREAIERLYRDDPDGRPDLEATHLEALRQIYFAELDKYLEPDKRTPIVIDKFPLNLVEAGLISRIFPQSRFLFALRHPCDCVLSGFMQNLGINEAMANFLDLEDAARLYDKVMTLWQHYQAVLPLQAHTVRYESLIMALEETVAPVLDFLGVDWDDGIRNYAKTAHQRGKINTP
ncbi:MAG: tetratricopeptide repeat protein, partial [Alphaproteobacteria bacterium]|nr:tetratricopeptide repeat protein [Alphaproteobacteria bacterium]